MMFQSFSSKSKQSRLFGWMQQRMKLTCIFTSFETVKRTNYVLSDYPAYSLLKSLPTIITNATAPEGKHYISQGESYYASQEQQQGKEGKKYETDGTLLLLSVHKPCFFQIVC